jgi:glycosyltransferase involved in cell wall biosynthesis
MGTFAEPFVSVVTPVYNGEAYLVECIESVLGQTYSNWEYIIVENCSTDGTSRIAEEYAQRDKRIRVYHNDKLLPIIANHNKALELISPDSKYCKFVSADDFIFPEFLARTVAVAEANPSVGIVGSYQLTGGSDEWYVRCTGLPYWINTVSGREICRRHLLTGVSESVFGSPTTLLYRCDLIRTSDAFFPNPTAEADVSACIKHLRTADFGFVHQVLSFERRHIDQITTVSRSLNAYVSSEISDLLTYGEYYLTPHELQKRLTELLDEYYRYLAIAVVNCRDRSYWQFQKARLDELGYPLDRIRLGKAIFAKVLNLLVSPGETLNKVFRRRNGGSRTSIVAKESRA